MKTPLLLVALVLVLSACGQPAPTEVQADEPTAAPSSTSTSLPPTLTPVPASTELPAPTAPAVATSRGPDLEATDPSTVALASGGLHFVEFFRFT